MDVVGDLLARDRRSRDLALVTPDGRERTYRDVITNAYKAANVLRYLGAREGATVAIDARHGFHPTLAFLGAARLGAPVRFDAAAGVDAADRVVLISVTDETDTTPPAGTNLVAFGGPPERPETTHWEQELWSENPATPPSTVTPTDPVVRDTTGVVSHRQMLSVADAARDAAGIDASTRVVVRTSLTKPRALAAGVIAPLAAGGTVVLGGDGSRTDHDARGDVAVVSEGTQAPEPTRLTVESLPAIDADS